MKNIKKRSQRSNSDGADYGRVALESAHFHLITRVASRASSGLRFGKCRSDRFAIIAETACAIPGKIAMFFLAPSRPFS